MSSSETMQSAAAKDASEPTDSLGLKKRSELIAFLKQNLDRKKGEAEQKFKPPNNYLFVLHNTLGNTVFKFKGRSGDEPTELDARLSELEAANEQGVPFSHIKGLDPFKVPMSDWVLREGLDGAARWLCLHQETAKLLDGCSWVIHKQPNAQRPDVVDVISIYAMPPHGAEIEATVAECIGCGKSPAFVKCVCQETLCCDRCPAALRVHTPEVCRGNMQRIVALAVASTRYKKIEAEQKREAEAETAAADAEATACESSPTAAADTLPEQTKNCESGDEKN